MSTAMTHNEKGGELMLKERDTDGESRNGSAPRGQDGAATVLLERDAELLDNAPPEDSAQGDSPEEAPSAAGGSLRRAMPILIVVGLLALAGGAYYFYDRSLTVAMDDASLSAPETKLVAQRGGTLTATYATVGDIVEENRPVARLSNEVLTPERDGTVISIRDDLGAPIPGGTPVATVIDRSELRAVGVIDEDQGLADVRIGAPATVTLDALGGQEFEGMVTEISEQPHSEDLAFSVSDDRAVSEFEVEVSFSELPDASFRQGMKARIWVEK